MDEYITIALPKGKLFDKAVNMLAKVGYSAENVVEDSRKLVISNEETKVRFIIAKTVFSNPVIACHPLLHPSIVARHPWLCAIRTKIFIYAKVMVLR